MSVRSFLDTNVRIYTDDHASPAKQEVALRLIGECRVVNRGVLSPQVLRFGVDRENQGGTPLGAALGHSGRGRRARHD